eukprot:CAMPEP_0181186230 /NCGR_PEP_ID=MMETSP1096-20121128/9925_1 /TAXON_ID=156174 ORGANISM="Chrysochromulina ericina, Strain CCMP281" /NCGR_SAMPLE_ID=MMETSP1096 /ASSEMBLY_ACC=CAM_ASM_000453 /LENGTH=343 /DNA_ID=CAMNT_0023275117 /DNA_START=117 /DNA_END=1148 /DNA_ORIENTATION=-
MRDPVATECMHRFCKLCIERCQRVLKKECPQCRNPIATRRSLRPDPNFAGLIAALYPDLESFEDELDEKMEAENEELTRAHSEKMELEWQRQRARQATWEPAAKQIEYERSTVHPAAAASDSGSASSGEEDEDAQEGPEADGPDGPDGPDGVGGGDDDDDGGEEEEEDDDDDHDDDDHQQDEDVDGGELGDEDGDDAPRTRTPSYRGSSAKPVHTADAAQTAKVAVPDARGSRRSKPTVKRKLVPRSYELIFRLARHPLEARVGALAKELVTVSCLAKVQHLQKYLSFKLKMDDLAGFQLHVRLPNKSQVSLRPDMTLHEVVQMYELDTRHLEFQFRFYGPLA